MRAYDVEELKTAVRVAMDENHTGGALLEEGDEDTLELDALIESKLAEAARVAVMSAPPYLLDEGEDLLAAVKAEREREEAATGTQAVIRWEKGETGKGMGWVELPQDFGRLVVWEMSDWERPVHLVIGEGDPQYALQRSRWAGLRGTPQRPVVAIVHREGGQRLEFYSCKDGEDVTVRSARYIPLPEASKGKLRLCPKLKDATVYEAAYMTALSLGATDLAASLQTLASEQMK